MPCSTPAWRIRCGYRAGSGLGTCNRPPTHARQRGHTYQVCTQWRHTFKQQPTACLSALSRPPRHEQPHSSSPKKHAVGTHLGDGQLCSARRAPASSPLFRQYPPNMWREYLRSPVGALTRVCSVHTFRFFKYANAPHLVSSTQRAAHAACVSAQLFVSRGSSVLASATPSTTAHSFGNGSGNATAGGKASISCPFRVAC